MIKGILFDAWFTGFHSPDPYGALMDEIGLEPTDYYFRLYEEEFMLREQDTIVSIQSFLERLGIQDTSLVNRLYDKLRGVTESIGIYSDTKAVLTELKKRGFKLGLITNTFPLSYEALGRKIKLDDYFDAMVRSYKVGVLKPKPEIFRILLGRLEINEEEAFMVGDTLETDIKGAERCGILKTALIDRKGKYEKVDHPRKIKSLEEILDFPELKEADF